MDKPRERLPFDGQELEILRHAANSLHESLVVTDRTGTILSVNPAFERMTGWSAAEAIGKTPRILKSGAHPEEVYRGLWGTILSGKEWHGTLLNRRKNGDVFPQEIRITPVPGADGRVTHFVSAARDVSESLQHAQESVAKQEIFEQVLESLGDVSFLADIRDRRFLYISPTYDRVTGYPGSEVLDDPRAALKSVHPEDVGKVVALLDQPAFAGDMDIEYTIVRPDGMPRRVHVRAWMVRDVHGEPVRFAGTLRDVTEARAKEQELVKSESLYRQAQKMEAVGRLAGGVAHDFNNMLTAILGYGEMLEDELAGQDRALVSLVEILKAGRRAADLTKRLLAFSRKQVMAPESLDLVTVVRDVEGMLRPLIG
ncbi:MAG: PAS domain S-box protein, partial [Planctomycetes bacterium]|nr:PAS domain S-box protein [Planctomycetota bacterium]